MLIHFREKCLPIKKRILLKHCCILQRGKGWFRIHAAMERTPQSTHFHLPSTVPGSFKTFDFILTTFRRQSRTYAHVLPLLRQWGFSGLHVLLSSICSCLFPSSIKFIQFILLAFPDRLFRLIYHSSPVPG